MSHVQKMLVTTGTCIRYLSSCVKTALRSQIFSHKKFQTIKQEKNQNLIIILDYSFTSEKTKPISLHKSSIVHYNIIAPFSALYRRNIPPFKDLWTKIRIADRRKMLTARIPKKKPSSPSFLKPVLPLVPEVLPKPEDQKSNFISMDLKSKAGGAATSPTYKKYIALFDEGTPQEWIDTQRDILEVWTQNSITVPVDKIAIVKAVLRGETLTTFDTALADARKAEDGSELALTLEMIQIALSEVSKTVFPHRALEIQKQWMRKSMKKPFDLSTRLTANALSRINNCLPLFPGGDENSKFSTSELLEILECSLPYSWRQKFDLDGYIPTDGTRAQLIAACEAIERSQESTMVEKNQKKQMKRKLNLLIVQARKLRQVHSFALFMGKTKPTTLQTVLA